MALTVSETPVVEVGHYTRTQPLRTNFYPQCSLLANAATVAGVRFWGIISGLSAQTIALFNDAESSRVAAAARKTERLEAVLPFDLGGCGTTQAMRVDVASLVPSDDPSHAACFMLAKCSRGILVAAVGSDLSTAVVTGDAENRVLHIVGDSTSVRGGG